VCARAQSRSGGHLLLNGYAHEQKGMVATCMRERITWYGYVPHSAAIFDAPDMSVYVVLDYTKTKLLVS